jgi:predicted ATPase
MFTDLVGFTELMQADEAQARARRRRYVDAMNRFHEIHGGTIMGWLGDGALSIFPSAAASVRCAADIQREIRGDDPVEMRVGIHIGDVELAETGLLGDAVNLASRIESFAVPGAVMLSDAIHDQVKNQVDLSFVDLGSYRLKNVGRPYRILALDAPGLVVPPPGHLEGKGDRAVLLPVTLPERSGRVFGRDDQLSRLSELLDERRLVTLIGPGGIGKTTLAVAAGRAAGGSFDAVAFVPLAAVDAPELVVPAIADTLEVKQSEERSALDGVVSFLGDHRVLLILDNFEQVSEIAPEIAEIVRSCPSTHVLVTSRGPLHLGDETVFPVAPLELPTSEDLDELAASPAVALLVDAAGRASPGFQVTVENAGAVAGICHALDGLPLALELAAARLRLLNPSDLEARLGDALSVLTAGPRDAAERHRRLRSTIEWSHSQLVEDEKILFRRLGVFASSASFDVIESVCGADGLPILDALDSLADLALVQAQEGRVSMLNTIAQFARERLADSSESQEIERLHAEAMAAVSETIRSGIEGGDQLAALQRGLQEDPDLSLAVERCLAGARRGDDQLGRLGLRIAGNLWMYWHIRGMNITARSLARALLEATQSAEPSADRAATLLSLGLAQWTLGRIDEANETWKAAFEQASDVEHDGLRSRAAFCLGAGSLGLHPAEARRWAGAGASIGMQSGDRWAFAFGGGFEAFAEAILGNSDAARSKFEEALGIQLELGDHEGEGFSLAGLAFLETHAGALDTAVELYERSRVAYATIGDRAEEARVLGEMAWVYLASGDVAGARRRFLDAIAAYEDVASGRGVGLALVGLVAAEVADGRHEHAVQLAAAAERLVGEEGIANVYQSSPQGADHLDAATAALSSDEVERARAAGRDMNLEQALVLARS